MIMVRTGRTPLHVIITENCYSHKMFLRVRVRRERKQGARRVQYNPNESLICKQKCFAVWTAFYYDQSGNRQQRNFHFRI